MQVSGRARFAVQVSSHSAEGGKMLFSSPKKAPATCVSLQQSSVENEPSLVIETSDSQLRAAAPWNAMRSIQGYCRVPCNVGTVRNHT